MDVQCELLLGRLQPFDELLRTSVELLRLRLEGAGGLVHRKPASSGLVSVCALCSISVAVRSVVIVVVSIVVVAVAVVSLIIGGAVVVGICGVLIGRCW